MVPYSPEESEQRRLIAGPKGKENSYLFPPLRLLVIADFVPTQPAGVQSLINAFKTSQRNIDKAEAREETADNTFVILI